MHSFALFLLSATDCHDCLKVSIFHIGSVIETLFPDIG